MKTEEIDQIKEESGRYREELYHFCLRRVNYNADIAENCIQDTYLTLEEVLKEGNYDILNCHGWLYKVLNNHIKRCLKEKHTRSYYEVPVDDFCKAENDNVITIPDPNADIVAEVENRELKRFVLEKATELLNADEKNLVIDFYLNNNTLVEIAKKEKKSVNSLKKRNQRLKKKLRKFYKNDLKGGRML